MSAVPPKADIIPHCKKCLLLAISGHFDVQTGDVYENHAFGRE